MSNHTPPNDITAVHEEAHHAPLKKFILAEPDPDRWDPNSLRHLMSLEPRVIPPLDPASTQARKFNRLTKAWQSTHAEIAAQPVRALELTRATMAKFVDERTCEVRFKFPVVEDDRYDPWRVLRNAMRQASAELFLGSSSSAATALVIQRIGDDLYDFWDARNDDADARFAPIRAVAVCLRALAECLRTPA